jgi:NADH:ubiquinone oxidoreductase subunit
MDEIKAGTLVGTDKYGNKYYENPAQFYGRNRWVEYAEYKNLEYDGSQIPAEWLVNKFHLLDFGNNVLNIFRFGWMHYKTDLPPHRDGNRKQYKWMADHSENLSGTTGNTNFLEHIHTKKILINDFSYFRSILSIFNNTSKG